MARHKLTDADRKKAVEKSKESPNNGKRGPSIKTQMANILAGEIPQDVIDEVVKRGAKVLSPEYGAKAMAKAMLVLGLSGDASLLRFAQEQEDGRAVQPVSALIQTATISEEELAKRWRDLNSQK